MVKQGGSQLSQLKSALNSAGLSRTSQAKSNGKKRKRGDRNGVPTSVEKEKRAARLETITKRLNPFEDKVTRLKKAVPGQRVKGISGRPGASKQAGLEHRKRTLLVEYDQRGRVGGVIDRRYGEDDPNMSVEQKMAERYTREKQTLSSKFNFNLEEEEELTHYGQSLNALDDFDKSGLRLEDDEPDEEASRHARNLALDEEDAEDEDEEDGAHARKKSKAEVMSELIEKSKKYKHERQVQKEKDEELRQELDDDFGDIRNLLFSIPGPTTGPLAPPRLPDPPAEEEAEPTAPISDMDAATSLSTLPIASGSRPAADAYDKTVKELFYEQRARPTDRIRTEEEVAAEEKAKLEKAERQRRRRMNGEDDYDSEEEDPRARRRRERARVAQGDDLDDDFFDEDDPDLLGAGLEADGADGGRMEEGDAGDGDEDDEAEDGDENESEGSEDDDEGSGDDSLLDEDGEDDPTLLTEAEELVRPAKKQNSTKRKGKEVAKELPFTFPCPETHEEFLDIIEDFEDSQVPTIVQRIRVLYHPSLAEGNKDRLEAFTSVLIEHLLFVASSSDDPFPLVNALSAHIFSLTKTYGAASARTFVSKLVIMQTNLSRGLAQGATSPDSKTFPSVAELTFLRVIGSIWSTSDFWHPVASPAMLLIGQYLSQGRIRSPADLASGLFLCALYLQYQTMSHRLMPEAVNFLFNACLCLSPHSFTPSTLPGSFPAPDLLSDSLRIIKSKQSKKLEPRTPSLVNMLSHQDVVSSEQSKVDLLNIAFGLVGKFGELYKSSLGFVDLFEPGHAILQALNTSAYSPSLKSSLEKITDLLSRLLKFARQARQPLRLQEHKPIAIPSVVPSFEVNFSHRKHGKPEDEYAKLKSMYKKEKKSAMKELRKDNRFLAAEKAKRQTEKDRDYNEKMSRAMGSFAPERAEEKKMDRIKAIQKMRAGKVK